MRGVSSAPKWSDDAKGWSAYLVCLLALGLFQLWDARLFEWYTDDFDYLFQIERLNEDIWLIFSPDILSSGRPTTSLFFLLFNTIWGEHQVPYHLGLILCHILTCWVVAWALKSAGTSPRVSMLAGLLLLFNVNRYEVPYWLSCVSYTGCMTFGCLGMVAYLRYCDSGKPRSLAMACLAMLLASTFHAGAVGFAALAGYYGWRSERLTDRTATIWLLPAVSIGWSTFAFLTYPQNAQNANVTELGDVIHNVSLGLSYLGRTYLSPHWLSRALVAPPSTIDLVIGAVLALLAAAAISRSIRHVAVDAVVWSALTLAVFSGSTDEEYRSRYFYFASVGPSLLIAWGVLRLGKMIEGRLSRAVRYGFLACVLIALVGISHRNLKLTESVFKAEIGRSYLARVGGSIRHGLHLMQQGMTAAPRHVERLYYVRYGVNAWYAGLVPIPVLDLGLDAYPGDVEIALLREVAGHIVADRALDEDFYSRVRSQDSRSVTDSISRSLHNAGSYHFNAGDYDRAEGLYAKAIIVDPGYRVAVQHYAETLVEQGRTDDATVAFQRFFDIGDELDYGNALPGLKRLLDVAPDNIQARNYAVIASATTGDLATAVQYTEEGLRLFPQDRSMMQNYLSLAALYEERGNLSEADRIRRAAAESMGSDASR